MKKKKENAPEKKKGKRGERIGFLRELYGNDPNIANDKALAKLLSKFPESRADNKSIITWKNMLRAEGLDIPKTRAAKKVKAEDPPKKKKKKKKKNRDE